jgi:hypothetical protein
MAKKKKNKRLGKNKPYDPTAPSFKTQGGFKKALNKRVKAETQPQRSALASEGRDISSRHRGREADLGKWYGYETQARKDASDAVSKTLNNLITSNQSLGSDNAAALSAALRQSMEGAQSEATRFGQAPAGPDLGGYGQGAAAQFGVGNIGMLGEFANLGAASGRDIGLSGVGYREAGTKEDSRYQALADDLRARKTEFKSSIPGIRSRIRGEMNTEEQGRQAQRFQQGLANRQQTETESQNDFQQTLADRQQTETEAQNDATNSIAQQQIGIDQQQVDIQKKQVAKSIKDAKDNGDVEGAKALGQQFSNGVSIVTSFFKPTKQEQGKHRLKKSYNQRTSGGRAYNSLLQQIMNTTGAGEVMARRILMTAPNSNWQSRAAREIEQIKAQRAGHAGPADNDPTPHRRPH